MYVSGERTRNISMCDCSVMMMFIMCALAGADSSAWQSPRIGVNVVVVVAAAATLFLSLVPSFDGRVRRTLRCSFCMCMFADGLRIFGSPQKRINV